MKVRFAAAPPTAPFDAPSLLRFARRVEAVGLDSVWLSDVPLGPAGDPLVTLPLLAGATSTIRLGVNVVPVGRNPFLLARQLAQIDQLSGGRLLVTFVAGLDGPGERAALGFATGDRGTLIEESLLLLRRWWAGQAVAHRGDIFDVPAVAVRPLPVQSPLEVWLAGRGAKALDRVARCGDGWLTASVDPEEAGRGRRTILRRASELGRHIDEEHFGISLACARTSIPPDVAAALRARRPDRAPSDLVPVGGDQLRAMVEQHLSGGLSKFVLRVVDPGDPDDDLEWLADVVLPLQS